MTTIRGGATGTPLRGTTVSYRDRITPFRSTNLGIRLVLA